jgi:hypothetical protein
MATRAPPAHPVRNEQRAQPVDPVAKLGIGEGQAIVLDGDRLGVTGNLGLEQIADGNLRRRQGRFFDHCELHSKLARHRP